MPEEERQRGQDLRRAEMWIEVPTSTVLNYAGAYTEHHHSNKSSNDASILDHWTHTCTV
jgi:hypothetical protein